MKIIEKPDLPKEIFAQKAAPQLLAQAVRVHLANQRQGTQSALTRAEVARTRKKFQKQKGSGNARHGDRKAPIFVGGGIAFAPKPRDHSLDFPKQMKDKSLNGALSAKLADKNLLVVKDFDKLSGKTSEMAKFLANLPGKSTNLLIITDTLRPNVYRSGRNIPGVTILPVNQVNTYEILKADKVILMEEAIDEMTKEKLVIKKEIKETKSTIRHSGNPATAGASRIAEKNDEDDSGRTRSSLARMTQTKTKVKPKKTTRKVKK